MLKSPELAMVGAVIGFILGLFLIILVCPGHPMSVITNFPGDPSVSPSVQVRVALLLVSTLAGLIVGFSSGFVYKELK
jgi:uncharacterized membrane protein